MRQIQKEGDRDIQRQRPTATVIKRQKEWGRVIDTERKGKGMLIKSNAMQSFWCIMYIECGFKLNASVRVDILQNKHSNDWEPVKVRV